MKLTLDLVKAATTTSPWDFGNGVLYRLCREHPFHTDPAIVIAKVWLIGRSYAAAIERRRKVKIENPNFYISKVGPAIINSDIDQWIRSVSSFTEINSDSINNILYTHKNVTNLFNKISDMDKRSLASKYLHFHNPTMFFIYDSRAAYGISKLSDILGRCRKNRDSFDNEYRKFAEKCLRLKEFIQSEFDISLTPRQIDNLLLEI